MGQSIYTQGQLRRAAVSGSFFSAQPPECLGNLPVSADLEGSVRTHPELLRSRKFLPGFLRRMCVARSCEGVCRLVSSVSVPARDRITCPVPWEEKVQRAVETAPT